MRHKTQQEIRDTELTDAILNNTRDAGYFDGPIRPVKRSPEIRLRMDNAGRVNGNVQTSLESQWTLNVRNLDHVLRKWGSTRNWDRFYVQLYDYYIGRGFQNIILAKFFNLLTLLFVVSFTTFLISCIDHVEISKKRKLSDAIVDGCPRMGLFHQISLLIFACFWIWELVNLMLSLPQLRQMQEFYRVALEIPETELQFTKWSTITAKMERLHSTVFADSATRSMQKITALDIVNRIMRKENYLIALFNKDVLNLSLPILGGRQMMTKVIEWNLNICLMNFIFGETDQGNEIGVRPIFLRDVQRTKLSLEYFDIFRFPLIPRLKKRFLVMALLNLILAPFTLVFLSIYFLFKYGAEFHKNPTQLGARSYTPFAKWKFREFNELPHVFQTRLNASYDAASKYVNQFPRETTVIIAKFISYVAGSIALSLTVLSLLDDDILLNFEITPGRSTLYYLGLFGIIWSSARGFVPDAHSVYEPAPLITQVISYTHYYPKEWKKFGLDSQKVASHFSYLFEYRILLFLYELVSIILAPFILYFNASKSSSQLLDFFRQFTMHVEGVGNVCTYAMFDFRQFNQMRGLNTVDNQQQQEEEEDKLARSMMHFKNMYTTWVPNENQMSHLVEQEDDLPHSSNNSQTAFIENILKEEELLIHDQIMKEKENATVYVPPDLPDESSDDGHELETDPLGVFSHE